MKKIRDDRLIMLSKLVKFYLIIDSGNGFFQNKDFKTSRLIGTGTEGGTGLFSVDHSDTEGFLAQSPQFYKQAMAASGLEKVFEIGCAYRAEKHEAPRHLNEYVSRDVETAWIDSERTDQGALRRDLPRSEALPGRAGAVRCAAVRLPPTGQARAPVGSPMRIMAVITEPQQVLQMLLRPHTLFLHPAATASPVPPARLQYPQTGDHRNE
jgi:hypothetical protein